MALAVADTVAHGGALVVEAGTGVGKTYAYLVPALLSGERVLISTATKALQDQLFNRDLPRLAQALGLPVRAALLKGRASYLCLHRLEQSRQDASACDASLTHALARVETWAQTTRSGDLAELPGLDERSAILPWVTSTRDNCLGSHCPQFRRCHVFQARREALAAEVVVVNHHLFFADWALRETGMAELLPDVRVVVFDEAHQIQETGVQFLGQSLGSAQMLDLARDLRSAGLQRARGMADWQGLHHDLEQLARRLRLACGAYPTGTRLNWTEAVPQGVTSSDWIEVLDGLNQVCAQACESLVAVLDMAPDFVRLHERTLALRAQVQRFATPSQIEGVRWVEVGLQVRLVEAPLDLAPVVQGWLQPPDAAQTHPGATQAAPTRAWVFTSATLGTDEALSWFTEPLGLDQARTLRVPSPFDLERQAALYIPRDLPPPTDAAHSAALGEWVAEAASRLQGRTLVLTTSLRALRVLGEALRARLPGLQVLVQGEGTRHSLMERFRQGSAQGAPGCVLVASVSFWEGVDVPGDALQLVVIDKLPFPVPSDPLVQAHAQRLQRAGRSPFRDHALPEAAVALKQGAGRLIRHETDEGILVVADTRLLDRGYGKRLMAALPTMRRLGSAEEFDDALQALITRTSTMDRSCP